MNSAADVRTGRQDLEPSRSDAILAAIHDGVYELALDGTIVAFNPGAERLLGYDAASVLGRDAHRLFHLPRDGAPHSPEDCGILEVLETGISYRGSDVFRRRDGQYIDVSLSSAAVLTSHGDIDGVVVVFHDITERLRREQMKDDFFAFAAHEVRNPLSTVVGFTRWLHRRAKSTPERFDADEHAAIESLATEAKRVAATIEVFLDLTRIQSDRLLMDAGDVDVEALVRQEAARLASDNVEAKISVTANGASLVRKVDPDRLRQVVENLMTNAVRYGGAPPRVQVDLLQSEYGLVVKVTDNGSGIREADQPHIFERFYQGARGSGAKKKGLGVGLYIASEIVGRMGGKLTFQTSSAGTCFTLAVPAPPGGPVEIVSHSVGLGHPTVST